MEPLWIAVDVDCVHPDNTKVRLLTVEAHAMWLGASWLVFEQLPGIAEPKLVSYEQRIRERGETP